VGFWNKIFINKKDSSVAEADKPVPRLPGKSDPEAGALADGTGASADAGKAKKSLFDKFESKVRRKVDSYVDNKADALLDDATKRAEQFRQETLDEVHNHAMKLLDLTEVRIDEKLVEIEQMLEKRLRAELKMRLRAMLWTLAFVLIMALVSFAYVWVKRSAGLDNTSTEQSD
jgi:vacuolar-type H+-ATPase subunit H